MTKEAIYETIMQVITAGFFGLGCFEEWVGANGNYIRIIVDSDMRTITAESDEKVKYTMHYCNTWMDMHRFMAFIYECLGMEDWHK